MYVCACTGWETSELVDVFETGYCSPSRDIEKKQIRAKETSNSETTVAHHTKNNDRESIFSL